VRVPHNDWRNSLLHDMVLRFAHPKLMLSKIQSKTERFTKISLSVLVLLTVLWEAQINF
jgi:hypothetical protein